MIAPAMAVSLVLAVAWLACACGRKQSAAIRHAIWTCAVFAALAAPLFRPAMRRVATAPDIEVPAIPAVLESASRPHSAPTAKSVDASKAAGWIWTAGSLVSLWVLLADWIRMRRLIRSSRIIRSAGAARIADNALIPGPVVAGFIRPVVVVPADFKTWSAQRRHAVLAHEFAHIRRRDALTQLAARLLGTIYWFNPLCWLALSGMRRESEAACDDAVLRLGVRPSDYAADLVSIARMFNPQPAIAMAAPSHLESRVKSILDPSAERSAARRRQWAIAGMAACAVTMLFSSVSLGQQPAPGPGELAGSVSDPSGARIPAATVTAINASGSNREITTTDAAGNFALHSIPTGTYRIEVRAPGFRVWQQSNTPVTASGTAYVKPMLEIGEISETVSVIGAGRPQTPVSIAGTPEPIRIGGNIHVAQLVSQVHPVYPADLQAQGVEGTVLLNAVIGKDGAPLSLSIRNSAVNPEFANAALAAVRQWRYEPTLLNGEPVEVATTITVDFRLKQ